MEQSWFCFEVCISKVPFDLSLNMSVLMVFNVLPGENKLLGGGARVLEEITCNIICC
ncbi:hypothetical protein PMIT1327_01949 [Prochlorococcus marinus str. MIT 1327]|nr:hypothetical protein PMIT1312_01622 [Prochlorococcus marinus str. MIT 1312]KZR78751.1 hypothetical protein PMIT1327_01949 [Prochlorococcus marinus str. MIT 1327]